jgi:hypothetical protein
MEHTAPRPVRRLRCQRRADPLYSLPRCLTGQPPGGVYHAATATSLSRALTTNENLGRPRYQTPVLIILGELSLACATPAQALEPYEQAPAISTGTGSPEEEVLAPEGLGQCRLKESRHEEGTAALLKALAIYRRIVGRAPGPAARRGPAIDPLKDYGPGWPGPRSRPRASAAIEEHDD